MKVVIIVIASLFLVSWGETDDSKSEHVSAKQKSIVGKVAPKLSVSNWTNTDGKEVKLKDLIGKVVILKFWSSSVQPVDTGVSLIAPR